MKKNTKKGNARRFAATWATYDHNEGGKCNLQCGLIGIFPTKRKARAAIDEWVREDVRTALKECGSEADALTAKELDEAAAGWAYERGADAVGMDCANGVENWYSISELKD